PLLQVAHTKPEDDTRSLYAGAIMLKTKGSVDGLESQIRRTLANINPNLTVTRFDTFADQIHGQFNQERLIARLTLMFGLLALVLTGAVAVLAFAACVAGLIPAQRAASTDPVKALRTE